jgi:hypothetical protein
VFWQYEPGVHSVHSDWFVRDVLFENFPAGHAAGFTVLAGQ